MPIINVGYIIIPMYIVFFYMLHFHCLKDSYNWNFITNAGS